MSAFNCAGTGFGTVRKKYAFPNGYTRSMKVNTAVELLVKETYQLRSATLARPKSYVNPATHVPAALMSATNLTSAPAVHHAPLLADEA